MFFFLGVCPKLRSENVHVTCKDKRGGIVDCDSPFLINGTQVRAECMPFHVPLSDTSSSNSIRCGEDGNWNKSLLKCTPGV